MPVYSKLKQDCINYFLQVTFEMLFKLASKIWCHLAKTYKDLTLYPHMYQKRALHLLQKNFSILERPLYKGLLLEKYSDCFFMLVPF